VCPLRQVFRAADAFQTLLGLVTAPALTGPARVLAVFNRLGSIARCSGAGRLHRLRCRSSSRFIIPRRANCGCAAVGACDMGRSSDVPFPVDYKGAGVIDIAVSGASPARGGFVKRTGFVGGPIPREDVALVAGDRFPARCARACDL
jgi:hypothetical protein